MKYTPSAEIGFLPSNANSTLMVAIVNAIAIKGEIKAMVAERSARFSSTNCMARLQLRERASAHQEAELLAGRGRGRQRLRQPAVKHHRDAVGNLRQLVEVLAGDQHRGARGGEIE